MPKPQWLIDIENKKEQLQRKKPYTCNECVYFGEFVKYVKYDGKRTALHECLIHPKCFNTEHSILCDDFIHI